jgi:glycosidase
MKSIKKNILFILAFYLILIGKVQSQLPNKIRVDPTNWYVGMKNPNLQLLVYGDKIASENVNLSTFPGVKLKKINKVENPNYLFLDIEITEKAKAGILELKIGKEIVKYELKKKNSKPLPLNQSDLIYLLMPDRFSNGEVLNDKFDDLADTNHDRSNPFLRHGGDLEGVKAKLPYLKDLGITGIWMTPVLENNQPLTNEGGQMRSAYHGYGFTDHYQVDRRLGGNQAYIELIKEAHKLGIKVIQDAVYNHVGINHWFVNDLPSNDWLNNWETYTNTTYKDQPLFDIYASAIDKKIVEKGWFTSFLPDLNQNNPFVANYLIQHALWCVEFFGIDSWRIDTYIYNDLNFMNRCNKALLDEYPQMHIFGESAVKTVISQAYFTKNNLNIPFKSNLPGALDFPLEDAIHSALNQEFGWDTGVSKLYTVLAQDIIYDDASKNVVFLDNHDHNRFLSVVGEDFNKFKMGLGWLMTLRGIPNLYYGTEIAMKNFMNPSDAEVRKDFPGGWAEDQINKFSEKGRTKEENEVFEYVKRLTNYRKNSKPIINGKFMQFVPQNGVYVYFRYTSNELLMVATNTSKETQPLNFKRYTELTKGTTTGKDIISNENIIDLNQLQLKPKEIKIIEINK